MLKKKEKKHNWKKKEKEKELEKNFIYLKNFLINFELFNPFQYINIYLKNRFNKKIKF